MTRHEAARLIVQQDGNCAIPGNVDCEECPSYIREASRENGGDGQDCACFSGDWVQWFVDWLAANPEPQIVECPGEAPPVVVFDTPEPECDMFHSDVGRK